MSKQGNIFYLSILVAGATMAIATPARAQDWVHPAGFLDVATLKDIKRKSESFDWARKVVEDLDAKVQPWLAQPLERLGKLLPKRKMQVLSLIHISEPTRPD